MNREWEIKRTIFSFADFLSWQKAGSLQLSPSFQRRSVWSNAQKSFFVDTVYRGLPVPIIFLRERTDVESLTTIREVVDGQQRLRTLIAYVDKSSIQHQDDRDFFVVNKKHNAEIAERPFTELTVAQKQRILSYQFSVDVLPSNTSDADVLSIFARMNATGSKLNDQELRNAEYFGEFKMASYELAHRNLNRWREWKIFSEMDIARMKEVEFVSSLLITIASGLFERTQSAIDKFYKENDDYFVRSDEIIGRFTSIMDSIEASLGGDIRGSIYSNSSMFLQLFHLVRRLEDAEKALTRARSRLILEVGEKLDRRQGLPEKVSLALASRFNRLSNQVAVSDYMFEYVRA